MMMAHLNGNLVKEINDALLKSKFIRNKFDELFGKYGEAGESVRIKILEYLLDRYIHMRGCWFVKFMKGNRNKTLCREWPDSPALR